MVGFTTQATKPMDFRDFFILNAVTHDPYKQQNDYHTDIHKMMDIIILYG